MMFVSVSSTVAPVIVALVTGLLEPPLLIVKAEDERVVESNVSLNVRFILVPSEFAVVVIRDGGVPVIVEVLGIFVSSNDAAALLALSVILEAGIVKPPSLLSLTAKKSPLPDLPSRNESSMVSLSSKNPVMIDDPSVKESISLMTSLAAALI